MTTPEPSRSWWSAETAIAAAAVAGIVIHLVLRGVGASAGTSELPLLGVLVVGGIPLLLSLGKQLLRRELGADWLAGISVISAVLLGEYLAGAIIVLMLSGGEALERWAAGRASSVLRALALRMPRAAWRLVDGAPVRIEVDEVRIDDTLVVLPHDICPVDGEVIDGHGTMDESFLTGEPWRIEKAPGSPVISGAVNGEQALVIRATKRPEDSRYAQILGVMRESEQRRPRIRRLADQIGAWYTPLAVAVAALAWTLSGDPTRFLAVVIIATPCPLLIAIPVALVGSISLAARRGIVIRDPRVLEQIDRCRTLIVDKTGTLTVGQPELTEVVAAPERSADEVLGLIASVERYSRHPLAGAIVEAAESRGLARRTATSVHEKPGTGLTATVDGLVLRVTSRTRMERDQHPDLDRVPPVASGLECVVLIDERWAATLRFHDRPRPEGRAFIRHLGPAHAFDRVLLVSGDRTPEVEHLARHMGITDTFAEQSPEQKVAIVVAENRRAPTLFVGDGINDAPALRAATVGIAFGQAHEATSEAAGAILLDPSLRRLDELMHIATHMRRIALQSAFGGMALSLIGMGFAAFGLLPPTAGALAQEVIDLAAVLNALRAARPPRELSDMDA